MHICTPTDLSDSSAVDNAAENAKKKIDTRTSAKEWTNRTLVDHERSDV